MIEAELTTEAVESAASAFQSVHNVHGSDGLSLGVLSVGDGVTDDVLQEHLEDTAGLLVDQTGLRFTPPQRARRRMAGLVIPWMLSGRTLRWHFAPPFPSPLPPLPRPDMMMGCYNQDRNETM
ncbi:hypothetical protein T265_09633 [Opisthorchis viverrini]|uniref:Uncharacterized protein n=1 Tax=Opisthorchis viverrini TaxID=6198 RepID=A0A074Z570_OPIVI|nr:hypothetical protein T265_09633 [Opisthorchis viverrini]KER22208.1 hypothetical protein T265_09633 [Opisthorchis viverrini]